MLRTRRLQGTAMVVAVLATLCPATASVSTAWADVDDGTLTVIVNQDRNRNNSYDAGEDPPQPGIDITVRDAQGKTKHGRTGSDGRYVLEASDDLAGGLYFVAAEIPSALDLVPVPESETFAPLSTTVDVSADSQTVRMGVAVKAAEAEAEAPPAELSSPPELEASRPARFAVGDLVWRDADRSGVHQEGESAVSRISVQLLNSDGEVVESTVSSSTGRYVFDDLAAGTYSIRFAGVPAGSRLTPPRAGDNPDEDSDPDYTGMTPPFTLDVGEPGVRRSTEADQVDAAYINSSIDAGITALRYAVGNRVWHDLNADGLQQAGEPPASATVSLLRGQKVVASMVTDDQGHYRFANLPEGTYTVVFSGLPQHRAFTARDVGSDADRDSDADPKTGASQPFSLRSGAANLVPASDLDMASADFVDPTISAGLVGVYSLGDTVWQDGNGNGVLDLGDIGVPEVAVQLLHPDGRILRRTVTSGTGRFTFDGLPAGTYRVQFGQPPNGLRFTSERAGANPAVDSDADPNGRTPAVVLGDENPADTTVDAGLTTPANYSAAPVPAAAMATPVDTELSSTGGAPPQLIIGGFFLIAIGTLCLVGARRPNRGGVSRAGLSRLRRR
ncbi:MAG TPA: SdrD B-like domain-containing protein [Propionibacteriaceae bacterium]|nr:SdrD B-like domain-containing protein [Propionibacteriaceae bacterium]